MCGLAGFIGLNITKEQKLMLVLGLADGIDDRGGHSSGYVSITDNDLKYARKSGAWVRSRLRFIEGATGDISLMHARYATCGSKEAENNAHPFAIRRNGRVVMWGAHNGQMPTAWESAKKNGRTINVDSEEIFQLLADKNYDGIREMTGYGVVTWIDSDHRDRVNLLRLSQHSDICVFSIKGGGIVWASTSKILNNALKFADLESDGEFEIKDIGRIYYIDANGLFKSDITDIQVGAFVKKSNSYTYTSPYYGVPATSYTNTSNLYSNAGAKSANDLSPPPKSTESESNINVYGQALCEGWNDWSGWDGAD